MVNTAFWKRDLQVQLLNMTEKEPDVFSSSCGRRGWETHANTNTECKAEVRGGVN